MNNNASPAFPAGNAMSPAMLQYGAPQPQMNLQALLSALGMTRDQFVQLSPQDKQLAFSKYMAIQQSHHDHSLMPPPPPRPPTSMAMAHHIPRPPTAMSHRSPTIPDIIPPQRPQSRMAQRPQQLFNQPSNPSSVPPQSSSPPMQHSAYRGAKRKITGEMISSPRLAPASSASAGSMGPPSLPRSVSGDSLGMGMGQNMNVPMNMGMNINLNQNSMNMPGMGASNPVRPQSSMAIGPGGGMNLSNINIPNIGGIQQPPQTPMRQPSLPPQSQQSPNTPLQGHAFLKREPSAPPPNPAGSRMGMAPNMTVQNMNLTPNLNSMPMPNMGIPMIGQNTAGPSSAPGPSTTHSGPVGPPMPNSLPMAQSGSSSSAGPGPHHQQQPSQGPGVPVQPSLSSSSSAGGGPLPSNPAASSNNGPHPSNPIPTTTNPANLNNTHPLASQLLVSNPFGLVPPPSLPAPVNLNPKTTHVTLVPFLTSQASSSSHQYKSQTQSVIPTLSKKDIDDIKMWSDMDKEYENSMMGMQRRMFEELKEIRAPFIAPGVHPGQHPQPNAGPGFNGAGNATIGRGGVIGIAGPPWWERGAVGSSAGNWNRWRRMREGFDIRYPGHRSNVGMHTAVGRNKKVRREGLKLPSRINSDDANRPEQLVPIRIEFDVEHHKLRDTFVWNLNDPIVTPEAFAQSVVEDYNLTSSYHSIIAKAIQDQLSDFRAHAAAVDPVSTSHSRNHSQSDTAGTPRDLANNDENAYEDDNGIVKSIGVIKGVLDEGDAKWWDMWRRRVKMQSVKASLRTRSVDGDDDAVKRKKSKRTAGNKKKRKDDVKREDQDESDMFADNEFDPEEERSRKPSYDDEEDVDALFKPRSVDDIPVDEMAVHEDMRILIKLDIIVGSVKLDDQFEWDLDNPSVLPEEFAEVYTQELGLGGEFKTAISHSIREQVQTYQKSLFLVGHPSDGTPVQDDDLKQSFLPVITSGARPVSDVQIFTPLLNYLSDGELERTEKERDKDLNKRRKRNTRGRRGIALPDREPIRTYRTPAIGFPELDAATLALQAAANAPMSRRAAAAAASLTIANMVASENGTAFMPQMVPSAAPQPAPAANQSKEKKPKGLFKPPLYPQSVLRPRAHVIAPTPSTAADISAIPVDGDAVASSSSLVMSRMDSKASKMLSAKKVKELEREAKEKEFVEGQHPNYIDGVWHCSNCGCPESIAVGRRKGPLGDKSQCGTCGKFWHRHRRPRPVEYNADPSFHSAKHSREIEPIKTPGSKKKGVAALRALSSANSTTPAASEPQTPTRSNGDIDNLSRKSPTLGLGLPNDDDRAMSPVSTASSASEPPLAQRVKINGANHSRTPLSAPTTSSTPLASTVAVSTTPIKPQVAEQSSPAPLSTPTSAPTAAVTTTLSPSKTWPPQWLSGAKLAMQQRYPNDKFDVILRKVTATSTPEWRIKCLDCPGKLYTPGPGETLSNYEVHLKNRGHRQRVNDRIAAAATSAEAAGNGVSAA